MSTGMAYARVHAQVRGVSSFTVKGYVHDASAHAQEWCMSVCMTNCMCAWPRCTTECMAKVHARKGACKAKVQGRV